MKIYLHFIFLFALLISLNACNCEDKWPRYTFTEADKQWQIPYTLGKVFKYANGEGDTISFEITSVVNDFSKNPSSKKGGMFDCPQGTFTEYISFIGILKVNQKIIINEGIALDLGLLSGISASLLSYQFVDSNESSFADGQNLAPNHYGIYYKKKTFGGKEYQNVYKCEVNRPEKGFAYVYYQKSYGVIGLEASDGKLFYLIN